jgi:hypothetical protein
MSPKAKSKGRLAATKLKSRRPGKGKSRSKRAVATKKRAAKTRNQAAIAKARKKSAVGPSNKNCAHNGSRTIYGR